MAHEIKNALVAGKTFIDLLIEQNKDSELVEVVRREIARIEAIVSRMHKFSGPGRAEFGQVHLHEVLDHSLRLMEPQLASKSAVLNRSFRADPDLLLGDDYQLQQAFVNLFLNALEALGPNGTLSVTTETCAPGASSAKRGDTVNGPHIRVAITDTGVGILPENMVHLFEPFFTTKPHGTGLGLAITRRIIQEHQGAVSVESHPGQGTTFQILLPAAA
jgi:two-component system NtrC family sensor kinase